MISCFTLLNFPVLIKLHGHSKLCASLKIFHFLLPLTPRCSLKFSAPYSLSSPRLLPNVQTCPGHGDTVRDEHVAHIPGQVSKQSFWRDSLDRGLSVQWDAGQLSAEDGHLGHDIRNIYWRRCQQSRESEGPAPQRRKNSWPEARHRSDFPLRCARWVLSLRTKIVH